MRRHHQVSPTWHDENFGSEIVDLSGKRIIDNSGCSRAQHHARVIEMPLLVRTTKLNPSMWCHRGLFKLQVTHIGYRESWKEKSVVKAYSKKRSHPDYTLPCRRLKSFASLDDISMIWATKTSDVDIPYAVPIYPLDGETCRYRSAHLSICLRASTCPPRPSPMNIVRHSNFKLVGNGYPSPPSSESVRQCDL